MKSLKSLYILFYFLVETHLKCNVCIIIASICYRSSLTSAAQCFLILQHTDISLAVPVSNSVTFIFIAITGWFLGEEIVHKNTYWGIILILCGTTLCYWNKMQKTVELDLHI